MKIQVIGGNTESVQPVSAIFKLRWPTCTIFSATSGQQGVEMIETQSPDIVLLEVDLPDIDGFEVLHQIRVFSEVAVVFLTRRGEEVDIIRGLEGGADDYIVKPYSALELLARVRATLRRSGYQDDLGEKTAPLVTGDVAIDFQSKEVSLKNESVHLTATEYQILYYLVRSPGKWITHESLEQLIWGQRGAVDSSVVRRYIHQLRRKLNDFPPQLIVNEPGKGYRFNTASRRLPGI